MGLRRDLICTVCGMVACAHLTVASAIEAAHPRDHRQVAAIVSEALPPEPDHSHQDFDRTVRLMAPRAEVFVSTTSSSAADLKKFFKRLKKEGGSGEVFRLV